MQVRNLPGVPEYMPNLRCLFDFSIFGISGNEQTSQSETENITYNCTLTYGTYKSFVSVHSFCINVYGRSYLPVLPIIDLINKYGEPTTPFKLAKDIKTSVSHLRMLFYPRVILKATANVGTKLLNIRHQAQNIFAVFLLEFHSIRKSILCMYHVEGNNIFI